MKQLNKLMYHNLAKVLLFFVISTSVFSCYTFTGSSLSPEVKSIQITTFPNYSALFNPNLSESFSNSLTDRFDQRTNLTLTNDVADIMIEGEINSYEISPVTVGQNTDGVDVATQNRLTIKIKLRYSNNIEEDKSFEKTYTNFSDFDADATLGSLEDELVEDINGRLIDQIFNDIVSDW